MNDFESRLTTALREEAEEFAMNVDVQKGASELDARIAGAEQRRRRATGMWVLAGVAALVLGVVGYRLIALRSTPLPGPVVTPTVDYSSSEFGLPFSADLPAWITTYLASPTSEKPEWVTWNRCPSAESECIGLSFNRTAFVLQNSAFTTITYSAYLAHLERLATSGAIEITARSTGDVGGRPATVLSILPLRDVPAGVGCHADTTCEDFLKGVPGRYAVIDTRSIDPDGEFLVVWTRAGAVGAAEVAWETDFTSMLGSLRFGRTSPSPS